MQYIHSFILQTCFFSGYYILNTAFRSGDRAETLCPCGGYTVVEERENKQINRMVGDKCLKEK